MVLYNDSDFPLIYIAKSSGMQNEQYFQIPLICLKVLKSSSPITSMLLKTWINLAQFKFRVDLYRFFLTNIMMLSSTKQWNEGCYLIKIFFVKVKFTSGKLSCQEWLRFCFCFSPLSKKANFAFLDSKNILEFNYVVTFSYVKFGQQAHSRAIQLFPDSSRWY